MAKAMSGMFRTHEQQHSWKPPPGPEVSREALTNALLETVRMVLEEQGPELQRLAPSSPGEQACWLRATPRHRSGTGQRPAALQASSRCSVAQV